MSNHDVDCPCLTCILARLTFAPDTMPDRAEILRDEPRPDELGLIAGGLPANETEDHADEDEDAAALVD